jgi:hypothetical protein
MASLSARALDWFGRFGASPIESGEVALRRHVLLGCSLACTVAGLLWSATYFAAGAPVAGAGPLAYAIISLASTAGFWFTGRYRLYLNTQLGLILLLPWMMSLALGGFQASSAVIIWSMLAPLGALLFDELRSATGWFAGFLGLVLSNAFLPLPAIDPPLPAAFVTTFYAMNIGVLSAIVFAMMAFFITARTSSRNDRRCSCSASCPSKLPTCSRPPRGGSRTSTRRRASSSLISSTSAGSRGGCAPTNSSTFSTTSSSSLTVWSKRMG